MNAPYGIVLVHNGNLTNTRELTEELFRTDRRHLRRDVDEQLDEYFAGERRDFDVELDWLLVRGFTRAALDAVRHLGVSDILMPLTPERVWRAIHHGGDGGDRATAGTNAYGGAQTETTAGVSTPESRLGGDR